MIMVDVDSALHVSFDDVRVRTIDNVRGDVVMDEVGKETDDDHAREEKGY